MTKIINWKKFIKDFIYDRLNQIGEIATIENKNMWLHTDGYVNLLYFLTCVNLVISIDNVTLLLEVVFTMGKYNKKLEIDKKYN